VLPVVPTAANLAFSGRPIRTAAPGTPLVTRFAHFTTTPKLATPSFTVQQRTVTTAAIRTYPEHAALFTHPATQALYDRPGLVTNANAPDAFKPGTTGRATAPTGTTYGRGAMPGTAASPANPTDPFARFRHDSLLPATGVTPAPSHATPAAGAPGTYRTLGAPHTPFPAGTAPPYQAPGTYRTLGAPHTPFPAGTAPPYQAPGTYRALGAPHTPFPAGTAPPYQAPGTYRALGAPHTPFPAGTAPPYQAPGTFRTIATPHPYGAATGSDTSTYHPVKHPAHAPHPSPTPH
jgi:hypothetical protein